MLIATPALRGMFLSILNLYGLHSDVKLPDDELTFLEQCKEALFEEAEDGVAVILDENPYRGIIAAPVDLVRRICMKTVIMLKFFNCTIDNQELLFRLAYDAVNTSSNYIHLYNISSDGLEEKMHVFP